MPASDGCPLNANADSEEKIALALNLVDSLLILEMRKKSWLLLRS